GVGAHAHEYGVVIAQQFFHGNVFTHFSIQAEFDTHFGKDFAATAQYGFLQLELGNTKSQQAADFGILVEYNRFNTVAHQNVGTANTGRASTNNGDLFIGPDHFGHVRSP